MAEHKLPEDTQQRQRDEDTEAILSRRRFLIASTLAGAGMGGALSGCRPQPPEPKVCLKPSPPDTPQTGGKDSQPQPCLSVKLVEPPKPRSGKANACLTVPEP